MREDALLMLLIVMPIIWTRSWHGGPRYGYYGYGYRPHYGGYGYDSYGPGGYGYGGSPNPLYAIKAR